MKVYHGFARLTPAKRGRCVAVGVFDGVHRGHCRILADVVRRARRLRAVPTAVTFDPDPSRILRPRAPHPILMSLDHRLRCFARQGIRETVVVRFDRKASSIPAEVFLRRFLIGRLGMLSLSVGKDFRFGRGGLGDAAFLRRSSKDLGFRLSLVRPLKAGGRAVSSTRIRKAIEEGRLSQASAMLGRPVSLYGTVVRGKGRGRKLGFPTANLDPHHETLPPPGVYAAWGALGGKLLRAVVHLGARPTFSEAQPSVEVHFIGKRGDYYGMGVELFFAGKLRPLKRFDGPEALSRAIRKDVSRAMSLFKSSSRPKTPLQTSFTEV